jgi:hypothetical protein
MKAKRVKEILKNINEILKDVDDDLEVFVRNSVNPCGNIQELEQIELSTYGFFGTNIPCLILNTDSSKKLERNENDEVIEFITEK